LDRPASKIGPANHRNNPSATQIGKSLRQSIKSKRRIPGDTISVAYGNTSARSGNRTRYNGRRARLDLYTIGGCIQACSSASNRQIQSSLGAAISNRNAAVSRQIPAVVKRRLLIDG
jgi:hypothetical protein